MKQLLKEYLSNYEGGFAHRNAIRYLYQRDLDLWVGIVKATKFLDDDAKPKQRCWHVLNDVWRYPRCPTTNEKVRWFENRYLTYISTRAQIADPANQKRKQKTMMKKYGVKHALQSKELKQKCADTWMGKYGVDNPSKKQEIKDKIKDTLIETGHWRSDEDKGSQELYNQQVDNYSEYNWRDHHDKINPNNYIRGVCTYHLDHIYPKVLGYVEGIDPKIIGHWTNLQIIYYTENLKKHAKPGITKEALIEKYETSR